MQFYTFIFKFISCIILIFIFFFFFFFFFTKALLRDMTTKFILLCLLFIVSVVTNIFHFICLIQDEALSRYCRKPSTDERREVSEQLNSPRASFAFHPITTADTDSTCWSHTSHTRYNDSKRKQGIRPNHCGVGCATGKL